MLEEVAKDCAWFGVSLAVTLYVRENGSWGVFYVPPDGIPEALFGWEGTGTVAENTDLNALARELLGKAALDWQRMQQG